MPICVKRCEKVSNTGWSGEPLGSESKLSAWPGSAVTLWFRSGQSQYQVTSVPATTVLAAGLNWPFPTLIQ